MSSRGSPRVKMEGLHINVFEAGRSTASFCCSASVADPRLVVMNHLKAVIGGLELFTLVEKVSMASISSMTLQPRQ